ncbi:hypothetical protein GGR57DRAFT_502071 [Xylariaceae sp. FL1272]|nr:hypothetical protein GGR57DRAFT_502071 [Xylariaceae sp. FL1272]
MQSSDQDTVEKWLRPLGMNQRNVDMENAKRCARARSSLAATYIILQNIRYINYKRRGGNEDEKPKAPLLVALRTDNLEAHIANMPTSAIVGWAFSRNSLYEWMESLCNDCEMILSRWSLFEDCDTDREIREPNPNNEIHMRETQYRLIEDFFLELYDVAFEPLSPLILPETLEDWENLSSRIRDFSQRRAAREPEETSRIFDHIQEMQNSDAYQIVANLLFEKYDQILQKYVTYLNGPTR